MEGPPDGRAPKIEEVYSLLRDIERRVTALEQERRPAPRVSPESSWPEPARDIALPAVPGGAFPVLGRALLGIAGAYLLRAAAESGTLPHWAAIVAAVLYAGCWLVSSSRAAAGNRFTIAAYGATAALVLSPMLWETTVRFQVIQPALSASVLVAFVALAAALAWQRDLASLPWIATLAGVATSMILIAATRQVLPFTIALLAMAVVVEYAACRDHWLAVRWLVAFTADFAVFLLTYLVTRPNGMPEGYAPVDRGMVLAIQAALLAVYLGSTMYRTLLHGTSLTAFEIGQSVCAFLIAIAGALEVTERAPEARVVAGAFCLVSGAACYLAAFALFESKGDRRRNFYTYSGFGLLLVLGACSILLPSAALAAIFSALAVAAMWAAGRMRRTSFRVHAASYIGAAVFASGLLGFGYDRLIGPAAKWSMPDFRMSAVAAAAALCYALAPVSPLAIARTTGALIAAVFCWSALAFTISFAGSAGPAVVATLRTADICLVSLLLAWAGRRWDRPELLWLLYPLMIGCGIKLLAEDFRLGSTVTMCFSLLFFGGALILVPRLAKAARKYVPHEAEIQPGLAQARRTT